MLSFSSYTTPAGLHSIGNRLLMTALFALLAALAYTIWAFDEAIVFAPLLLIAIPLIAYLFANPLANTAVVLFGFVALTDYSEGLQVTEIIYGLYLFGFLAHWYFMRLFVYRQPFIRTVPDRAIFAFLLLCTAYLPIAFLFNGNVYGIFAEWRALVLLAFYFPVKETVREHRNGAAIVLTAIAFVGLFVAVRNLINYREMLLSATQLWQIARGRISTNDNLLMIASITGLVMLVFARRRHHQLVALAAFVMYFSGLILTQSRGYWLAFLVGAGIVWLVVDRRTKRRMFLLTAGGGIALLVVGLVFLQDYVALVYTGLIERIVSLKSAASADISLVNRFRETAAVWHKIVRNPILGYGMGVSYEFFDITRGASETDAFVHNGYVSLWYKYGLLGLGLMLTAWLGSIVRGIRAFSVRTGPPAVRLAGLIAASALSAFMLSCITSNPFFLNDTLFAFAILMGASSGALDRVNTLSMS